MKLSNAACRNAKPRAKDYNISDGEGLNLLVKSNGSRLWRLAYRFEGRQKTLSLGRYPDVSLADARDLRREAKRKLAFGKDPRAPDDAPPTRPTFRSVMRDWHSVWSDGVSPIHAKDTLSRLECYVASEIGDRPIEDIQAPDLIEVIRKIEARGYVNMARRIRQACVQIFDFAIATGHVRQNPASGIQGALKKPPQAKHFVKVPMGEIPRLLARLACYGGDEMTRLALKFTLLTWARSNETRFARWDEFEGLGGAEPIWRIPAARMKKAREHIVPLAPQAVALLKQVPRSDTPLVFWSTSSRTGALSTATMIFALYRMGYHSHQTVHGFRRIASTWANETLVDVGDAEVRRYHEDWVEMQLSHKERSNTRGAYNAAEYLKPRRQMLCDWADLIEEMEERGLRRRRELEELL